MTNKTVTFHDDPPNTADTNKYKDALNRAKAAQREKPGDLQNTPRFDQTNSWKEDAPDSNNFLSPETKRGLEQLAISAKQEAEQHAKTSTHQPLPTQAKKVTQEVEEEPAKEKTEDEKLREAIEARISTVDIGEFLMSGELKQTVPIIPGKLEVTFKTVTDLEESYVDTAMSKEPSTLSNRQFVRKMNELALAIHIHSVNGNAWPKCIDGDGTVNVAAMEVRLKNIQKLSSPIFSMISQNLSWFLDRVTKELTVSALGNG
jgi:hypothetical protein